MTYLGRELSRRHLAVVTFVLISFLISGKLVRARPQENSVVASSQDSGSKSNTVNSSDDRGAGSSSSETREVVTAKTDPEIATVESDNRNEVNANDVVETKSTTAEIIRSVTGAPVKFFAEYSVNSALDFGRAAAESSTKPPSTSVNTLKPFNKHLLSGSASDMVADVRTPPKIKSQISHSHAMQSMSTPGKGEAIPVVLDGNEEAALEKISSDNFKYTHSDATPVSGLSTWILLNSDAISTPFSHKKAHKPVLYDVSNLTSTENSTDVKRKAKPNASTTTTENSIKSKIDAVVMKKPERKPIATIQKVNQTHVKKPSSPKIDPDVMLTTTGVSLQDLKFKNKTPVIMGKVPVTTAKMEQSVVNSTTPIVPIFLDAPVDNGTRLGTPVVTYPHVPVRQRPSSSTTRKPLISTARPPSQPSPNSPPQRISSTPYEFTVISTSSPISTEATSPTSTENSIAETSTETTTKKSTTSKKKKKKNKKKNKRRRPSSKKPSRVQSKISEDDNSTSKLPNTGLVNPSKPISTRIYNYLAREVMPNVGVGLVGLMLTAGLAGLLLYPFGAAVPIRRNYEKPSHPPYNLNDYPPINEVDNAQPEESVLSQVLAGMSNTMNQYSREQPDLVYKNPPPPKYKPARFDNLNTFTHLKDVKFTTVKPVDDVGKYSELGDVVSGPHESVKFTSFDINDSIKYPMESSQPSPSYSTLDLTTSSQNEPVPYHTYKGTISNSQPGTIVKAESAYSTLGEYSSYSNPNELIQSPVYTGESYDYKNHKQDQDMQEFKVSSELEVVTQISDNQTTTSSPTTTVSTVKPVRHEQPSFAALEGIPKNYRTLQTSIRFEEPASVLPMNQDFVPSEGVGVYATSVEHGPRSLRFRRRKRNTSSENELDSVLMDQHTSEKSTPHSSVTTTSPTEKTMSTTENEKITTTLMYNPSTVNSSDLSNDIFEDVRVEVSTESKTTTSAVLDRSSMSAADNFTNATTEKSKDETTTGSYQATCENCDLVNVEEPSSSAQTFSLSTLLRKLLNFKLRLGLELIRATSEVIGRYLGTVQARMTEALRNIQRSAFRTANPKDNRNKKVIKRRDRRQSKLIFDKLD